MLYLQSKVTLQKHEAAGPTAVNGDPYSLSHIDPREHCCSCAIELVSH